MINYVELLEKSPNGVLATTDGKSIKTRVFQYLFADGNKVYFGTNSQKPVYTQLVENPNVSFCTYPADYAKVVSISGKVNFTEDKSLKERALTLYPQLKGMYQSADNPIFKIFYIDVKEVETFDFVEGTKNYTL